MPTDDETRRLELEGAKLAPMLVAWAWIDRRVDSVVYMDDVAAQRTASITFQLPNDLTPVAGSGSPPLYYVPLTLIGKDELTHFDFVDEGGRALPLLPAAEKAVMGGGLLIGVAEKLLTDQGLTLTPELADDLRGIAGGTTSASDALLERFLRRRAASPVYTALHASTDEARLFRALTRALGGNFMVIVPVRETQHDKRLIRFSYRERVRRPRVIRLPLPFLVSLTRSIGWTAKQFWFWTPAIGHGGTYHFEIAAPTGLKITQANLTPLIEDAAGQIRALPSVAPREDARNHPHLMYRGAPPGAFGLAHVKIRARGSTVIRAAWFTTVGIALLLTLGNHYLHALLTATGHSTAGAAALLLVIPGASLYIAGSSEHEMTTSVLYGVRVLVLLSGLTSFLAAGLLIVAKDKDSTHAAWDGLMIAAIAIAVTLTITVINTWREDESFGQHWARYRAKPPPPAA